MLELSNGWFSLKDVIYISKPHEWSTNNCTYIVVLVTGFTITVDEAELPAKDLVELWKDSRGLSERNRCINVSN